MVESVEQNKLELNNSWLKVNISEDDIKILQKEKKSIKEHLLHFANQSILIVLVLAIWAIFSGLEIVSPSLLPAPWTVVAKMWELTVDGILITDILVSLKRVLVGFLIAVCLATPLGLFMGSFKRVRIACTPLIELLRPIPTTAMISLAILWFGIGEASKYFIIAWAAFFPIVINVFGGMQHIEPVHIRAAQSLGANKLQIFINVSLRSAMPYIILGMRNGLSLAFICLVSAELIAASSGLGYLIQNARYLYRTDEVLVGIISIGILGFIINKIVVWIEKKLTAWQ